MPKLTIDIPDALAQNLSAHPLPLPLDEYCRRALDEAVARHAERRLGDEALVQELGITVERRLGESAGKNELYSQPEAARILGISPDTLRKLVKEGKIPSTTVGRRALVSLRTIRRIVNHLPEDDLDLSGALKSIRRSRSRTR